MITEYIYKKLNQAQYKIIEDGSYFGEIPGLQGVWASEKTLEECRETLREVLEETGLDKENIELIDENPVEVTNDMFPAEGKHYTTLYFRAKYISGKPERKEPDYCEGWGWFDWNNLPYPLFQGIQDLKDRNYNPFER